MKKEKGSKTYGNAEEYIFLPYSINLFHLVLSWTCTKLMITIQYWGNDKIVIYKIINLKFQEIIRRTARKEWKRRLDFSVSDQLFFVILLHLSNDEQQDGTETRVRDI